jgi:dTDP-4-amino-4,6-dideoxygalactose transaminase
MLLTNNEELGRRASNFVGNGSESDISYRSSLAPEPEPVSTRGYGAFLGTTYGMTDLEAALGLAQYDRWDDATRVRIRTGEILNEVVPELPGFRVQQVRPGDVNSYYTYAYKVEPDEAGVSSAEFAEAVNAEGIPDCHGPYISGRPLYTYPLFTEEDTYGGSRFPFVDEQGNRRIDYSKVHLPVIERDLPMTGSIYFRNSYTEQDARDIAAAMKKVSDYYASRRR